MQEQQHPGNARAQAWRKRFRLQAVSGRLESAADDGGAGADRIERAREEMRRIVKTRLGSDAALLDAVDRITVTAREALDILEQAERAPESEEYSSLEAIVAFDGTRPSFLVRHGQVDLDSSFSTSEWKVSLAPKAQQLADFAACAGRVERGGRGLGTAFLLAPTLAVTNRHVAQLIADFAADGTHRLREGVHLDFGREHEGRAEYDRREVRSLVFAGRDAIAEPVDHRKLDLALLELSPSPLPGEAGQRFLRLQPDLTSLGGGLMVVTTGYPADWQVYVPGKFRTQYEEVLAKLLEGEKGSKRLAPGLSGPMLAAAPVGTTGTATHDATTINGNSGSPLGVLQGLGRLPATGLHYGGQWQGDRTNWAHVLGACMGAPVTGGMDLRSALRQHGVL